MQLNGQPLPSAAALGVLGTDTVLRAHTHMQLTSRDNAEGNLTLSLHRAKCEGLGTGFIPVLGAGLGQPFGLHSYAFGSFSLAGGEVGV